MTTKSQYRWLARTMFVCLMITALMVFIEGMHFLWPVGFGVGLLVTAWAYGDSLSKEKVKKDTV